MLDDSFTDLERQIEAGEIQVALLELLDDMKRVQIVIEPAAVRAHQLVKLAFPRVPERRVAHVMHQNQRLGEIGIEPQRSPHRARDLGHLPPMCETNAKNNRIPPPQKLPFFFPASETA